MKKIIIGFSMSKKKFPIGSWIIRIYQWTRFSHVYIRVSQRHLPSDTILHASEGKVQKMSGTQFDLRHEVVYEFSYEISNKTFLDLMRESHEISGDDYSVLQNVGIIFVDFLRIFGIIIRNPFRKGWNCSEYAFTLAKHALKSNKLNNIDPNTVTPKQLFKILKEV